LGILFKFYHLEFDVMATKFIGRNSISIFGKCYDMFAPERRDGTIGNANTGFMKFHIDVGLDAPIVVSRYVNNIATDDTVRELAEAIKEDRALVMIAGYIQPNQGTSGIFQNLTATNISLVGQQPDVETHDLNGGVTGGGSLIHGTGTPEPEAPAEAPAEEKPKRVRASRAKPKAADKAKDVVISKADETVDSNKPF
jgi:hypothetical protein